MSKHKHWLIFGSEIAAESRLIQGLLAGIVPDVLQDLRNKKGVLFSNYTLQQFIKEEACHDNFALSAHENRSVKTFSSGEQRKALLEYLLSGKPDFLILDNAFDMLDVQAQSNLKQKLAELSQSIPILQLFKHRENVLPFIDCALQIENGRIRFSGKIEEAELPKLESKINLLNRSIPPPFSPFKPEQNPLVEFKNVSVNYGERTILKNINWKIKRGEFWQLSGPNGSGKTTLLTMITGDNPKAYGESIMLFGKKKGSGESIWDIKQKIGYVTPAMTFLFNGRHSVENMVISGLTDSIGLYKNTTDLQKRLAHKWIGLIGLSDQKKTPFSRLTESQQCMVLIARAMIKHPPLLILDEPTHGLDDENVSLLIALVNRFAEESETTLIYVSHRNEPGLKPQFNFELVASESGSVGIAK